MANQAEIFVFLAEHYPWASPEVVENMTPQQQQTYIEAALRKLERETGITAGPIIHCGSVAEARARISQLKKERESKNG